MKERLDVLLVKRGLAPSREKAKTIIMSGIVFVDNQRGPWSGGEPPGLRCPRHCTALTPRGSTALLRRNAR